MNDSGDPSWQYYSRTVLRFRGAPLAVKLWESLSDDQLDALRGVGSEFAIITAYNPFGREGTAIANRNADRRLRDQVDRRGWKRIRVIGESPDGDHAEPGYAIVGLSKDDARTVAEVFEQTAFFWFGNGIFSLVSVASPESPIPLPASGQRPNDG